MIKVHTLKEVAAHYKKSYGAVWGWCRVGVRGVRLEYMWAGGTMVVTDDALEAFMQALRALDAAPVLPRQYQSRRRAANGDASGASAWLRARGM